MGILEDLAAAIEAQSRKIEQLTAAVAELREKVLPQREVYTLRDLAELPEAPALHTLRNSPARQPNRGQADGYKGAQKAWRRATVEAWRRELTPGPSAAPRLVRAAQG